MRAGEILGSVAVAGAVATFALVNVGTVQTGNNFMGTPITEAERNFINFISEHHRSYGTKEEYEYRLSVFADKYAFVQQHNAENNTYKVAINQFSDLTQSEYEQRLGFMASAKTSKKNVQQSNVKAAASIDWVAKGAVTGVKDQGQCGSCWSFSTTGALEGAYFLSTGTLESFSEQQFVDCDRSLTTNHGCNGGLMDYAFEFAEKNKIERESDYPYTAVNGDCQAVASKGVFTISGYHDVTATDAAMEEALTQQPVSVAIQANQLAFQSYSSGVLTGKCGDQLDHGVLAVGYGTDSATGLDYYKVKNSWGSKWGEAGYIRLVKGSSAPASGQCGILTSASYPIV